MNVIEERGKQEDDLMKDSSRSNDFNIISTHMKEISIIYEKLLNQSKDIKQSIEIQKLYSDLNNLFSIWSSSISSFKCFSL